MNPLFPNGYGLMPMDVLEDRNLSASAKLLYTLIQSFSAKTGKCWASNETLAERLGMDHPDSVTRLIRELKKHKYIHVESKGYRGKIITLLQIEKKHQPDRAGRIETRPNEQVDEIKPDQNVGFKPDHIVGQESNSEKVNNTVSTNVDTGEMVDSQSDQEIVQLSESEEVAEIMHIFKGENESIEYGNTTERGAAKKIIRMCKDEHGEKDGFAAAVQLSKLALHVQDLKYAPIISTPYELWKKCTRLKAFVKRSMNDPPDEKFTIVEI